MNLNNNIFEEIKHIECPVDEIVDRVISILENYNPNGQYQIVEKTDDDFINDNIKIYNAYSEDEASPSIGFVVKEGLDHYVAEVVDAYELEYLVNNNDFCE
ncbi:MAG: hypothetical protein WBL93_08575 [Lutisporaceae bacterium]